MAEKTWDEITTPPNPHPSALLGWMWTVREFVSEVKSRKKGYGKVDSVQKRSMCSICLRTLNEIYEYKAN